ncbi:MAG: nucleotide exchange factor GrpE [Tenericutes bacterium]|jgi:molecular chaperone GrpE|nr:nucleotide exchange factor GrpE [Mycoplasmatota bacterium]
METKKDTKPKSKIKIEELNQQIASLNNEVLLARADNINYRKRKDEEVANLIKYANVDLILDILLIIDNFERAIKLDDNNLNDELSKFLEGFKMIYSMLNDTLKQYGLEELNVLNKPFNPNNSQALIIDNDSSKDDGIVLDVMLKGYIYKDRVIRPASVKVNKIEKGEKRNE